MDIIDTPSKEGVTVQSFGELPAKDAVKEEWLWEFRGCIRIISTDFHEGVHYATRPEHLIPIIDHLEQLHENGYVHGDIRAYNMVLNYPKPQDIIVDNGACQTPKGWLIDFDYGGMISANPKYPKGYVNDLKDGSRKGVACDLITPNNDWFALGRLIFHFYHLGHADTDSALWSEDFRNTNIKLMIDFPAVFRKCNGNYESLKDGPAKFLRDYLQLATTHGFVMELDETFLASLKECHLMEVNQRNDSKGATGSPPKPKH